MNYLKQIQKEGVIQCLRVAHDNAVELENISFENCDPNMVAIYKDEAKEIMILITQLEK